MPTLGEILNMGNKKLIHVPEGFELRKKECGDKLSPNGIIALSVFRMKQNGDLGDKCFSGCCLHWKGVVNEISRCMNSTHPFKFHMSLSFKLYNKTTCEEMFHGTVTQEVLDELIKISEKYLKEE